MLRRGRVDLGLVAEAIEVYQRIPIRFVDVDLSASLEVAAEHRLYAYDAYFIECARSRNAPLLTLDRPLARAAEKAGANLLEVS